ncbi:MAG: hypothetical protein DI537_10395 [Stutzerimonas stutzeri]|nr:MAG: hypothetical protein DI537_10395 [Stutzerimonas stutzeri]
MSSVDALLRELEKTLINGSPTDRSSILTQITDLFISTAEGLRDDQIGFFDIVISRVSHDIEREARSELAQRLAPIPNAPVGVIRQLAMDEIDVARPVLATSKRLTNDDLLKIGEAKGEKHMLAMTTRDDLGEGIADYLVLRGGQVVTRALASNPTAKFSTQAMGVLVMRAVTDHELTSALSVRHDLPPALADQIIHLAKLSAQRRLKADLEPRLASEIDSAVEAGAKNVAATTRFSVGVAALDPAQEALQAKADDGSLTEAEVCQFAKAGDANQAICGFAAIAGISVETAHQVIHGKDENSLLLVTRALGWSWETVSAMISLRTVAKSELQLQRAKRSFEALAPGTGVQVLNFLRSS